MRILKYMLSLAALATQVTFVGEPAHARIRCYATTVRTAHGNTPYPIEKGEIVEINSYEKSTGMVGVVRLGNYKLQDFANFSKGCNWKSLRENGGD